MGRQTDFNRVNLFTGIIYHVRADLPGAIRRLEKMFSAADLVSETVDFEFTDYYFPEMGKPLKRKFISFRDLIPPEDLPRIKWMTNELEDEFSESGKRSVNLDPGYLSDANVIIATTKNYYQRVPLTEGIYAHMEYVIKGRDLKNLEWTYPDFRTEAYKNFFRELLPLYKQKISSRRA